MRVIAPVVFLLSLSLGYVTYRSLHIRSAYLYGCELVWQKFYKDLPQLEDWYNGCKQDPKFISYDLSHRQLAKILRRRLAMLGVSHLDIYLPKHTKSMWHFFDEDTGLVAEWVEGNLVVVQITPGSPAEAAGFRVGDQILSIDGSDPDPLLLNEEGGQIKLQRLGSELNIKLLKRKYKRESKIEVTELTSTIAQLKVPSFHSKLFQNETLASMLSELNRYEGLVLDLRGNPGGNFVAGLRLLSHFFCEPTPVGVLDQPRLKYFGVTEFQNDLDDSKQLDALDSFRAIELRTFKGYGCFSGPVITLVDSSTASVAEIVAESMRLRECSSVVGAPTAGQVVLAVYHPAPLFPDNFQISVPEASFVSNASESELEGAGVTLDALVYKELEHFREAKDSTLVQAAEMLPQCETKSSRKQTTVD